VAQAAPLDIDVNDAAAVQDALLAWYDQHARRLPWRTPPGSNARPDPYRVWLSEVMLQQTTAAAVAPRYERFLARFPTLQALAEAPLEALLQEWAGLGYYARARNLHAAAQAMAREGVPPDEAGWRALPGVGAYTAAAVAAIAFGEATSPVDGNVERVVARLVAIATPPPTGKAAIRGAAAKLAHPVRPGDWAQALMDLGATICTPRRPACALCPLRPFCAAAGAGEPERYPVRAPKSEKPLRFGRAYWLERSGAVWLVRRAPKGLLGGMPALPSSGWGGSQPAAGEGAPAAVAWRSVGAVEHVFTHFRLQLEVVAGAGALGPGEGWWAPISGIEEAGLPTVFLKAARLARAGAT